MLGHGYSPLAVHTPWSPSAGDGAGKRPLVDMLDHQPQPWTQGHSRDRLMRVTLLSANTGLLLGGESALAALDIDPAKGADADAQWQVTSAALDTIWRHCPALRGTPLRLRGPASALLLFRTEAPMTKVKVAGEWGAVELLGQGQHVVVDGWHPRSLGGAPVRWRWHRERAPWTVPAAELPVIPAADVRTIMSEMRAAGLLGPPRSPPCASAPAAGRAGGGRGTAYEATARLRTLLDRHGGRVRPAVRELVAEIGAEGCGRHDALVAIAGRLVGLGWTERQAVELLVPIVNDRFGDGDWSREIETSLRHAHGREVVRQGAMKSMVWGAM